MRISIVTVLFSLSVLGVVAPRAHAEDPAPTTNAEQHSKRGVELYAEGKLPEAVSEMLKAYDLAPAPGLLYNIARIYQKMAQPDLAIHYLKKFVTQPGADPDRVQKALKHLEELRKARARPRLGETPPLTAPEPPTVTPSAQDSPRPTPELISKPAGRDDTLAWVALSSGGAALIVGGVLGGLALNASADLSDVTLGYDDKVAAQDAARARALGADVCIGVGLAAATLGLVLFLTAGTEEAPQTTVAPTVGPDHFGAQLMVRFP